MRRRRGIPLLETLQQMSYTTGKDSSCPRHGGRRNQLLSLDFVP